jgi:predicted phage-related endonuclease
MKMMDGTILKAPLLTTLVEDISALSDEEYALARRKGLGASDSSVLLGVNPYKQKSDLIVEKRSKVITDEERAIKMKDAVRKGFDLEPLILQKYVKLTGKPEPIKPTAMYQIKETPCLTINFDGVGYVDDHLIPVEAKFVTTYGDKYYKREHAFMREFGECSLHRNCRAYTDPTDRIKAKAEACGIPPYYYTQVQQQMYGLGSPFGYLVALHDKGWETVVYFIPRDEECIHNIIISGTKTWMKIDK